MSNEFQIIYPGLLKEFESAVDKTLLIKFDALGNDDVPIQKFDFYTSVSAVYSSKIEGESVDLDSFLKHKSQLAHYQPDYTKKIDDLYDAYFFAQETPLDYENVLSCHRIITMNILQKKKQGEIRKGLMYVLTGDGKIEYVAAGPQIVTGELQKLFNDIQLLLQKELPPEEVFYFAAMVHLIFVKIHPFEDGNGRMGRLLEKWFLSEKIGKISWRMQTEKYYYDHHDLYYKNIRLLGLEYDTLKYDRALPFLLMLPQSLQNKQGNDL